MRRGGADASSGDDASSDSGDEQGASSADDGEEGEEDRVEGKSSDEYVEITKDTPVRWRQRLARGWQAYVVAVNRNTS